MSVREAGADAPRPGSIHYFAELYAPPAVRVPLRNVHTLEAEIRASLKADLDHGVAHARLDWWQQEAARAGAGSPSHPLLRLLLARADAAVATAALDDWVQAARIDLAGGLADPRVRAEHARRSAGAGFALAATLLAADAAAARELGASLAGLHAAPAGRAAAAATRDPGMARGAALAAIGAIAPRDQPALRPLLVWAALALRRTLRGDVAPADAPGPAALALLGDNLHAWRAARAADAGRIHHLLEVPRS
jgi:hypothetical protein